MPYTVYIYIHNYIHTCIYIYIHVYIYIYMYILSKTVYTLNGSYPGMVLGAFNDILSNTTQLGSAPTSDGDRMPISWGYNGIILVNNGTYIYISTIYEPYWLIISGIFKKLIFDQ